MDSSQGPLLREVFDCQSDLTGDEALFADCCARASSVREGYWSPFVTLAWISSGGDGSFVAATQIFEEENCANDGSLFSIASWMVLGNEAGARFGLTFTDALAKLREALEARRLNDGVATNVKTGDVELVPRHTWTKWDRAFENYGLSLIPGLYDFKWPSEAVRAAFPPINSMKAGPAENEAPLPRWVTRNGSQRELDRQKHLMKFFDIASQHLPGGTNCLGITALRKKYVMWLAKHHKGEAPLTRDPFNKFRERYLDGWRSVNSPPGWKKR